MFKSEKILTQAFGKALLGKHAPFKADYMGTEFDYREGRTDVLLTDMEGNLLAFEMKLDKWMKALHQAYRNSSFAHYSYVVLPRETADRAARRAHEFIRRGVGLCCIEGNRIEIKIAATRVEPLRPWLLTAAIEYLMGKKQCLTTPSLKK